MFLSKIGEWGLVADDAESVLHDDGARTGADEFGGVFDRQGREVEVGVNGSEAAD